MPSFDPGHNGSCRKRIDDRARCEPPADEDDRSPAGRRAPRFAVRVPRQSREREAGYCDGVAIARLLHTMRRYPFARRKRGATGSPRSAADRAAYDAADYTGEQSRVRPLKVVTLHTGESERRRRPARRMATVMTVRRRIDVACLRCIGFRRGCQRTDDASDVERHEARWAADGFAVLPRGASSTATPPSATATRPCRRMRSPFLGLAVW